MSFLPFSRPVTLVRNPGTSAEQRLTVEGSVQAERGFFPATTPMHEGDIIETPDPRGGFQRLTVAHVKIHATGSDLDHLEVAWGGVVSKARSGAVIQTFHGPVGVVQTGNGVTANVIQNVGAQVSEIGSLLESVLRASADLEANAEQEVREQVADLRAELAEAAPRSSRVRAFLGAMWQVTREVATVAPKVLDVAEKLGYPILK
jgi:hypothetical protein